MNQEFLQILRKKKRTAIDICLCLNMRHQHTLRHMQDTLRHMQDSAGSIYDIFK